MNLSNFYARMIGFYLVIMSIGMFFKPQQLQNLLLQANGSVMTVLGIVALTLGLAIVSSHQVWKGWPIIITLLGYWVVIKGILIIFYPDSMVKIVNILTQGNNLTIGLSVDLVLGIILLILGYRLSRA